jgi:hypothetical protein
LAPTKNHWLSLLLLIYVKLFSFFRKKQLSAYGDELHR